MNKQNEYVGRDLEAMAFAYNYHSWILSELRPYIGNRLVEVGAGMGDFTKLLVETNPVSIFALEPSGSMFPLLSESMRHIAKVKVCNQYFGDLYPSFHHRPDTVLYINVLEHIEDDEAELSYAFDSLVTGGHICIFVPALQWLYGSVDESVGHYRRYNKKALINLVQSAGFEIVKARYFDIAGILPWWLLFCVLKMDLGVGQVSVYDRFAVPVIQRLEHMIVPPVGKNLLVVGRKNGCHA